MMKTDKTHTIPPIHKYTIDLRSLTPEEEDKLKNVLIRDFQQLEIVDTKVSILRKEIGIIRKKGALRKGDKQNSICARCKFKFFLIPLPFVDQGRRCIRCQFRICKRCVTKQINNTWLCSLCLRLREEKMLTGDWLSKGTCFGSYGSELLRASLKDRANRQPRVKKRRFTVDEGTEMMDFAKLKEDAMETEKSDEQDVQLNEEGDQNRKEKPKKSKKERKRDRKNKHKHKSKKNNAHTPALIDNFAAGAKPKERHHRGEHGKSKKRREKKNKTESNRNVNQWDNPYKAKTLAGKDEDATGFYQKRLDTDFTKNNAPIRNLESGPEHGRVKSRLAAQEIVRNNAKSLDKLEKEKDLLGNPVDKETRENQELVMLNHRNVSGRRKNCFPHGGQTENKARSLSAPDTCCKKSNDSPSTRGIWNLFSCFKKSRKSRYSHSLTPRIVRLENRPDQILSSSGDTARVTDKKAGEQKRENTTKEKCPFEATEGCNRSAIADRARQKKIYRPIRLPHSKYAPRSLNRRPRNELGPKKMRVSSRENIMASSTDRTECPKYRDDKEEIYAVVTEQELVPLNLNPADLDETANHGPRTLDLNANFQTITEQPPRKPSGPRTQTNGHRSSVSHLKNTNLHSRNRMSAYGAVNPLSMPSEFDKEQDPSNDKGGHFNRGSPMAKHVSMRNSGTDPIYNDMPMIDKETSNPTLEFRKKSLAGTQQKASRSVFAKIFCPFCR